MDFISGTLIKVDELANTLQVCLDSGAKKVLIPSTSFVDFVTVTAELASAFQIIPYQSAEDAVFKALGVDKKTSSQFVRRSFFNRVYPDDELIEFRY